MECIKVKNISFSPYPNVVEMQKHHFKDRVVKSKKMKRQETKALAQEGDKFVDKFSHVNTPDPLDMDQENIRKQNKD